MPCSSNGLLFDLSNNFFVCFVAAVELVLLQMQR